jgi:hypothetical protein
MKTKSKKSKKSKKKKFKLHPITEPDFKTILGTVSRKLSSPVKENSQT